MFGFDVLKEPTGGNRGGRSGLIGTVADNPSGGASLD
jgi:hypothetical protein